MGSSSRERDRSNKLFYPFLAWPKTHILSKKPHRKVLRWESSSRDRKTVGRTVRRKKCGQLRFFLGKCAKNSEVNQFNSVFWHKNIHIMFLINKRFFQKLELFTYVEYAFKHHICLGHHDDTLHCFSVISHSSGLAKFLTQKRYSFFNKPLSIFI